MIIFINDNMLKTADELLYIALYQVPKSDVYFTFKEHLNLNTICKL